jgi:selenocysteine lyase/cysteine desulfurase
MMYADDAALGLSRSPIVTEDNVADIQAEEQEPTRGIPRLKINEGALKFEASPYHNFACVCGLRQAVMSIRAVGKANLHSRLHDITSELVEGLKPLDGRVVSPRGGEEWSGVVSFALNGADPKEIVRRLRAEGVYIAMRKGRLRICPHYYNTSAEVGEFLSVLGKANRQLMHA